MRRPVLRIELDRLLAVLLRAGMGLRQVRPRVVPRLAGSYGVQRAAAGASRFNSSNQFVTKFKGSIAEAWGLSIRNRMPSRVTS